MMTDIIKEVKLELEFNRQVIHARKQELLNEAEAAQLEIDQINIRLHTVEDIERRCEERLITCVPAPVESDKLKDYVDEAAVIVEQEYNEAVASGKIPFQEAEKPLHVMSQGIEGPTFTGDYYHNGIIYVMKKNQFGMPITKNRLTVSVNQLDQLVQEIKKSGKVHMDDMDSISAVKYGILGTLMHEYSGADGKYKNIKFGSFDGDNKKYLYWDKS